MIVKIWPVKADYAKDPTKVGGVKGLKNALDYITDDKKVIVKQDELHDISLMQDEINDDELIAGSDTIRVINYMANKDKIESKYISGYLCDPENAISDFDMARTLTLAMAGENRPKETGAISFHIVQSFPKELDISNEEVHQCGIELCEKINAHQAVICSHVHPEIDEKDGKIHGECKHNHILINAYIHPDKVDPENPRVLKYNDCKESYAQLRKWNDEIAIAHGLPIIRNPNDDRTYSWKESDAVNKGLSWKERVRSDIDAARRITSNWAEFVSAMENSGYSIRDTAHVTYTTPDGEHKIRDEKLGEQYTKDKLILYWNLRDRSQKAIEESVEDNTPSPLFDLVKDSKKIYAGIPLGKQIQKSGEHYYLPLTENEVDQSVLQTYFNPDDLYSIYDDNYEIIAVATGMEILKFLKQLQYDKDMDSAVHTVEPENEYAETRKKKKYYTYVYFINSKTKKPYRTSLYDEKGRRRSSLELLFILAITVLKKEDGLWKPSKIPLEYEDDVLYAPTNWKIQNLLDSMYTAQSEGIESLGQLEQRLKDAGAAYNRTKYALKKTVRAKEKMDTLNQAVSEYRLTSELAEKIHTMPDGQSKIELQEKYADVIVRYKNAKAIMYRFQVTEESQIIDFENRYAKINEDIMILEDRLEQTKEEYTKLKKLSYNAKLAENAQYCYGPLYTSERLQENENQRPANNTLQDKTDKDHRSNNVIKDNK